MIFPDLYIKFNLNSTMKFFLIVNSLINEN